MVATRGLGGVGILLLAAACSGERQLPRSEGQGAEAAPPAQSTQAPAPPRRVPELPLTGERDQDGDRLDDVWRQQLRAAAGDARLLAERVRLEVILNQPLEQAELDAFSAEGGSVEYVFRELSYGFTGTLALERVARLAGRFGDKLHLVAAPSVVVPFLDEATRTGRVRGVWASGFAGSGSGYSGNSNITIAVVDSGIDQQHSDLSGRKQGWQDYTADNSANPDDAGGHGTHVAGIAVGSGAAFQASGGVLAFTQTGDLSTLQADTFSASPIHAPAYFNSGVDLIASARAAFQGSGEARLFAMRADDGDSNYQVFGSDATLPLSLENLNGGSQGTLYAGGLIQSDPPNVGNFYVVSSVQNYPAMADGFNTLRGVAPASRWFGAKVFPAAGMGNSLDIEEALDDLVARRVTDNIKIANLSLGVVGSGIDTSIRAKVNTTVDAGIVVVVAAGNDFPQSIGDPGRAAKAITVGASNDVNELAQYTSSGVDGAPPPSADAKPDVLAPGGSAYRSQILAADSGSADTASFADQVENDYANLQGTSMAAPFVSGSLALMIDALQQSGTSWSFGSNAQPLFLKMLLLASATELNAAREEGAGDDPTLGRASALRDRFEGYGIVNPDAAIEAMLQTFVSPLGGSVSNALPARLEWERRAWGRKLSLVNGATVLLNLAVPATADFDLYLFSGAPDGKGNPLLRSSSTSAGSGNDETIDFVSAATETAYLFVKRVSGHGSFSLTGSAVSHCGDGKLDSGELCDPAMAGTDECCTHTCSTVSDGTDCDDGDECTQSDTCQAGSCSGDDPVVCAPLDQCHAAGSCVPATGLCTNPNKTNGSGCDDGNLCTQTDACQAGTCTGSSLVVCTAQDQCHDVGVCAPGTGVCTNPAKTNGADCDDGDACTQTDACQAGICSGAAPIVCTPSGVCHDAGACEPSTGQCSDPNSPNGTACGAQGSCQAGACVDPPLGDGGASSGGAGAGGAPAGDDAGAGGVAAGLEAGAGGVAAGAEGGAGGVAAIAEAGAGGSGEGDAAGAGPGPGSSGTGGASSGASGGQAEPGAGAAPVAPQVGGPNTSSGCGCRLPGGGEQPPSGALALLGLVVSFGACRRAGKRSRSVGLR